MIACDISKAAAEKISAQMEDHCPAWEFHRTALARSYTRSRSCVKPPFTFARITVNAKRRLQTNETARRPHQEHSLFFLLLSCFDAMTDKLSFVIEGIQVGVMGS